MDRPAAPHLFAFGFGYSARALAAAPELAGWRVSGTTRSGDRLAGLVAAGIRAFLFDRARPLSDAASALADVSHLLISIPPEAAGPPEEAGDPVLARHTETVLAAGRLRWVGYLSTTGVYGDTGGAVVDETAPPNPTSARSVRRAEAERGWLDLHRRFGLPVHVFRLAGIYGPGRSALDQVRRGEARRILRPGHLFSRIHVEDVARVLVASMRKPRPGAVYNVCDDEPAAPADVVSLACELLGVESPPPVSFEEAVPAMSAMARSFWKDNRRVDNGLIRRELGVELRHPNYRSGLVAIAAAAPEVSDARSGGERQRSSS